MSVLVHDVELQRVSIRIGVGLAMAVTPHMAATGVKLIRNQNIKPNKFDDSSIVYLDPGFAASHAGKIVRQGDVVIVRTGANIGDACVVPKAFDGAQSFTTLVVRTDQRYLAPEYLAQFINSGYGRSEVERLMAGGGKGNLNSGELARLRVKLPPIDAQRKTAALLSNWDTSIEATEKLIAAKEAHFASLIRRLIVVPAEGASWQKIRIREIADRVRRQGDGKSHPLLTISSANGFVRQEEKYTRYMAGESAKTYTLLHAGEFSYNKGNSLRYEFGCVFPLRNFEAALVPSVYVSFKPHNTVNAAYLRHLFSADYLKPQLRALVKTGVRNNGLLNISPDEFMGATVPLPSLEEQERIATFLDAAEAEIALLKNMLARLRVQKRGLMQKLLTGQWQLPRPARSMETA